MATLMMGAALTVLPAGAFAQERFDNGWHRDYREHDYRGHDYRDHEYREHEYREHQRRDEREREWRNHERREIRRDYQYDPYGWR